MARFIAPLHQYLFDKSNYQKTGFTLIAQEEHHSFGHDLVGETWELML